MHTKAMLLVVLLIMPLAGDAHAAKCKFEIEQVDHVESRRLVLFRGATVGLGGHFGVKNGVYYLKGLFGSNFKSRAVFNEETPLELTLANDRTLTLGVITEAISSKLKFGHIITASREAQPVFSITSEQWSALRQSPIVSLRMPFEAKGERVIETRKVKSKHAQKVIAAIECVAQTVDTNARVEPKP